MNLSLEVAKIMWPDYEWRGVDEYAVRDGEFFDDEFFNHTTPEAGFQMAVWLAGRLQRDLGPKAAATTMFMCLRGLGGMDKDPNRALAEAIVETHNG